jgi:glycosyltransferase involved in cell wall biosynthesis
VIGEAAGLLAGQASVQLTLIGRGQDYEATRAAAAANASVEWIDWIDPGELPSVVAAYDVCLGIFGTGPKALRVVPNKVYQGAAAGTAVVTSDTRPQRDVLDRAAVFVAPGDARALADALIELASSPARVEALRVAAYERALLSFRPASVTAPLYARVAAVAA